MEKTNRTESFKGIISRSLLSLTLLTAPILSTGCGRDGYNPDKQEIRAELDKLRDTKQLLNEQYKLNTELISNPEFFEKLVQIFVYEEYLGYCERENKGIESFESEVIERINQYFQSITEKVKVEGNLETSEEMLNFMIELKSAFHESLGRNDAYDKNHPNIVDPVFEAAFQCRSGSEFILNLMSRYYEQINKFRLVRIFTNGHQIPGFIDGDGNLIGVESTAKGRGVVDFGNLDQISIPIVVTDYRYDLASQIISDVDEKNVILKNNPSQKTKNIVHSKESINSRLGVHDGRGFGYVEVPPGRRNLVAINSISHVRYNEPYDFYSEQDRIAEYMRVSPEIASQISVYSIQYQTQLDDFWKKHVDLFNNRPSGVVDYRNRATDLIDQIDNFLKESGAEAAYQEIDRKLEQEGKALSVKSPYRTRDSIAHNLNIGLNKY